MDFELSIINGRTVSDIVRARRCECIQVVEEAYRAHADGLRQVIAERREIPGKVPRRTVTFLAVLGEAALHDPAQRRRRLRID